MADPEFIRGSAEPLCASQFCIMLLDLAALCGSTKGWSPMNQEGRFSPVVETALRNAGWQPGRALSVDELRPWCVLWEGDLPLVIFPAAYAVLKEFGGLRVSFSSAGGNPWVLHFDPTLDMMRWFEYGWQLGLALYPVGFFHHEDDEDNADFVGIDSAGKMWVFALGEPYFIGADVEEGIEYLAAPSGSSEEPVEIGSDEQAEEAEAVYKAIVQGIKSR